MGRSSLIIPEDHKALWKEQPLTPWNDLVKRGYVRRPDFFHPWYHYTKKLLSLLKEKEKQPALDVGCGVGEFLHILKNLGFVAEGIDGSPVQVEKVLAAGYSAKVANLEMGLPYPDQSFFLVTLLEVIEHIARAEFLLSEIRRVLRSPGWLLLTTPNFGFFNNRLHYLFGQGPCNEGVHLRFLTQKRLQRMLLSSGFEIIGRNSYGVVPGLSTITIRLFGGSPVLWSVPRHLEGLWAYDFVYLLQRKD